MTSVTSPEEASVVHDVPPDLLYAYESGFLKRKEATQWIEEYKEMFNRMLNKSKGQFTVKTIVEWDEFTSGWRARLEAWRIKDGNV